MTRRTNGNGAGSGANDITVTVIGGALDVFEKDGHRVVSLIDVVMVAVEAALQLGLSGVEAERMAQHIQRELVECLAQNGVGIIDANDSRMWLPGMETESWGKGESDFDKTRAWRKHGTDNEH